MLRINFSESEVKDLHHERFFHSHPFVRKKMEAVYLKAQGLSQEEICRLVQISPNTLRSYLKDFIDGGIDKLKEINFASPKSELNSFQDEIKKEFQDLPPKSLGEAQFRILNLTGIKRSRVQIGKFLKRIGLKIRKVGMIPAKANLKDQDEFKGKKLLPRLEEAKKGQRVVFFADAAHFVHKAFLGFVWCMTRVFIKAPSGRKRFNVSGALDPINQKIITVSNTTYINALSVCELLNQIAQKAISVPITLVLDNARYQKCKLVQNTAKSLNIELLFLPPYSPNLNLIERFWKFVKKECLYSNYYEKFNQFQQAITQTIDNAFTDFIEQMKSLLTLKFQTFKKTQNVAL